MFIADADPSNTTDPAQVDSDGDGIDDGVEDVDLNGAVDSGETDPSNADSDGDGCNDGDEINTYSIDPLNIDTDGDGVDDCTEISDGTDPLDVIKIVMVSLITQRLR